MVGQLPLSPPALESDCFSPMGIFGLRAPVTCGVPPPADCMVKLFSFDRQWGAEGQGWPDFCYRILGMVGQWVDGEDKWGCSRFSHKHGTDISKAGGATGTSVLLTQRTGEAIFRRPLLMAPSWA